MRKSCIKIFLIFYEFLDSLILKYTVYYIKNNKIFNNLSIF